MRVCVCVCVRVCVCVCDNGTDSLALWMGVARNLLPSSQEGERVSVCLCLCFAC